MIKIIQTADWHVGEFRGPVKDGKNLRAQDTLNCLQKLADIVEAEKPDYVLISGDLFHEAKIGQERGHKEAIQVRDMIEQMAKRSGRVIAMRGTPNHDSAGAFEALKKYTAGMANVEIVTEPTVLEYPDMNIALIPGFDRGYFRAKFPGLSKEEENEAFTMELGNICAGLRAVCDPDKPAVLMAHYTVPGCNMEAGQSTFFQKFEPVLTAQTLNAADYDMVCLGHIHRPQKLEHIKNCWYSGAINAMNFNDEGQERGFYIHELDPETMGITSRFIRTPFREFITFRLTDTDITAINLGQIDPIAYNWWRYNGCLQGKIARILYQCNEENKKSLNRAELERVLYEDGAFYVWDIMQDKPLDTVDRKELSARTDPEENLIQFLEDRGVPEERTARLVEKARPIIADAFADDLSAEASGLFRPVSIKVRNYRNYEEEFFDFSEISFCTINGQNGAGKSSLFMDAIIDCLYEQTREGELTGWIRNDEAARSGSIEFTFSIGDTTWRVTRTRAKSGKPTLNLAELVNGEWENRSHEKAKATQEAIEALIGMDCMTFKSCALIMQDQYGLFLEAKKQDRMDVLGKMLGLGLYSEMESAAAGRRREFQAKAARVGTQIETHEKTIAEYGNPKEELSDIKEYLSVLLEKQESLSRQRQALQSEIFSMQEAQDRCDRLQTEISQMYRKKCEQELRIREMDQSIKQAETFLKDEQTILDNAGRFRELEEQEKALAGNAALYHSKLQEAEKIRRQVQETEQALSVNRAEALDTEELLRSLIDQHDDTVFDKQAEYLEKANELTKQRERREIWLDASLAHSSTEIQRGSLRMEIDRERERIQMAEDQLKQKTDLLLQSGCVDPGNATCKFLADAKQAEQKLLEFPEKWKEFHERTEKQIAEADERIRQAKEKLEACAFDEEAFMRLSDEVKSLYPYMKKADEERARAERISTISGRLELLRSDIAKGEENLRTVKCEETRANSELSDYAAANEKLIQVQAGLSSLRIWMDRERQLPVYRERLQNATERKEELTKAIADLATDIERRQTEIAVQIEKTAGLPKKKQELSEIEMLLRGVESGVKEKQMQAGAVQQKLDEIRKLEAVIETAREERQEYAGEEADYDMLKAAFSQDGIPHQIVRDVIPQLTQTANTILGQMTGGKMGVEFRLEKMNTSKNEKPALDIYINEYGKSSLPYLSKSGGEKVKASLSVVLALAELKTSAAGIQLGMLHIDEPPFLDSDGIQAYCDALETIQNRYPDLKVMAITHDSAMKARFPQSVTIEKDENGSHVRWD